MSKFIPGLLLNILPNHTLGKHTGLLPFGLFTHVKEGHLHPLNKNGEPISPPDIEHKLKHQRELEQTLNVLPLEYGRIEALYQGEAKEAEKQKLDKRKESLQKEYKDLKQKLGAIKDKYSWADYELPQELIQKQRVFDLLQASYFHEDEVRKIGFNVETPLPEQEEPGRESASIEETVKRAEQDNHVAPVKSAPALLTPAKAEEFIRSIEIAYLSDTEVMIRRGNQEEKVSCDNIGLKATSKPWVMFISILQDRMNQYYVGLHDKKKNPDNLKDYRCKMQLFPNFSKKLIPLINDKFSVSLESNFNVFKNMKNQEHAGIYKPKFLVYEYTKPNRQADIKSLSREATLEKLDTSFEQYKREKDNSGKDRLLIEIRNLAAHAKQNSWKMTGKQTQSFLDTIGDDSFSDTDAMGIASFIDEVTEKDKYRLY